MTPSAVRVRFAPSPTGSLHIGGVRTALFNWLFARHHRGTFILRIDDTDPERSKDEFLRPILDGFRWLGLEWDEGPEVGGPHAPYFQSQRFGRYRRVVADLLARGKAYPCYVTPAELDDRRRIARDRKESFVYRGEHRDRTGFDLDTLLASDPPPGIRFRVPEHATVEIDDAIRGRVRWETDTIGDFYILRSDGTPMYNLASVVDDVDFEITHVIRAVEHLSNTAPQALLIRAMGHDLPTYAHLPYVAKPGTQQKLSKREGGATLAEYIDAGYLPRALLNYLARLGWSLDDATEKMSLDEMVANFSLDRVNDSPAAFDRDKLLWLQGEYMRELPVARRAEGVIPFLQEAGLVGPTIDADLRQRIADIVAAVGDRMKVFSDIVPWVDFFFLEPVPYDPKAVNKRLAKPHVPSMLSQFREVLRTTEPYEPAPLEEALLAFAQQHEYSNSKVVHPVRVAVTGKAVGPGLFDCLALLGRDTCLRRIDYVLNQLLPQLT